MIQSWDELQQVAGVPSPLLINQKTRLFGASAPKLRLWHDSAAWHPFANQVWLLVEEMNIPHVRATVPLEQYKKPGERMPAEFTNLRSPVPIVQLCHATHQGSTTFGSPLGAKTAVEICRALNKAFPELALMPRTRIRRAYAERMLDEYNKIQSALYQLVGSGGPQAEQAYIVAMNAFDGALSGCAGSGLSLAAFGDDGSGNPKLWGGELRDGPFLFGVRPSAIDMLLLPMLERMEAFVPHKAIGNAPHLALPRWPNLHRLLLAARVPGVCCYSEIAEDWHTVVGARLSVTGQAGRVRLPTARDLPSAEDAARHASSTEASARNDAAARLCNNHAAVARFAASGCGLSRPRNQKLDAPSTAVISACDDALRFVAAALLAEASQADAAQLRSVASAAAASILTAHAQLVVASVVESIIFLAENIGVPRDMAILPAQAFRAHIYLIAAALCNKSASM